MEQETSDRNILLKVVKHPFITTPILSNYLKKNEKVVDKIMEKYKRLGYVKYARQGNPKSWAITDTAVEKFSFEKDIERKPLRRDQNNSQKGGNQGNSQGRRNNNQSRGNNQGRNNNNSSRGGNQSRNNNQNRRSQVKGKAKSDDSNNNDKEQDTQDVNTGGGRSEGPRQVSRKDRQEKINELFLFFKEHSEHSFTAAEIQPEFGITVSHLNSLLYELLGYGDVMKQFNTEEQQLVWYLADCHLESNGKSQ